jgi:hypothetical protein
MTDIVKPWSDLAPIARRLLRWRYRLPKGRGPFPWVILRTIGIVAVAVAAFGFYAAAMDLAGTGSLERIKSPPGDDRLIRLEIAHPHASALRGTE